MSANTQHRSEPRDIWRQPASPDYQVAWRRLDGATSADFRQCRFASSGGVRHAFKEVGLLHRLIFARLINLPPLGRGSGTESCPHLWVIFDRDELGHGLRRATVPLWPTPAALPERPSSPRWLSPLWRPKYRRSSSAATMTHAGRSLGRSTTDRQGTVTNTDARGKVISRVFTSGRTMTRAGAMSAAS
jgi:hypothetical protein